MLCIDVFLSLLLPVFDDVSKYYSIYKIKEKNTEQRRKMLKRGPRHPAGPVGSIPFS